MRFILSTAIVGLAVSMLGAQDAKATKRHGVASDLQAYPQGTPKDALASVLKAIDAKRIDYLLAHLADPEFVDKRVDVYGGKFEELVKETTSKLGPESSAVKHLRRLLKDGEWETGETASSVRLKDGDERRAYFRKAEGRWCFENAFKKSETKNK